jgi:hypothetical protein
MPQRQAGDPPGYKPGGFKAFTVPEMALRESVPGDVVFDLSPLYEITGVTASTVYPMMQKELGETAMPREEVENDNIQMVNYLVAKQLISSAPNAKAWLSSVYGKHLGNRIMAPNGFVALAQQYGTVKTAECVFEVAGHVVWTSTALMRGIGLGQETFRGVVQAVDRTFTIAVDVSFPNPWNELVMWCAGVVNQFSRMNVLTMQAGQETAQLSNVRMLNGFSLFFQAFQMTNFPPYVIRAIRIGILAEDAIRAGVQMHNMNAAMVPPFNAQGVVFLDWDRRTHDSRFATYLADVQHPLSPVYDLVFKMVSVSTLSNHGDTGQLLSRMNFENVYGVQKLGVDQLDLGVLLCGEQSGVIPASFPYTVRNTPGTVDHKNNFVQGMLKSGKNKG